MIQIVNGSEIGYKSRFDEKLDDALVKMSDLYESVYGDLKKYQAVILIEGEWFYVLWSRLPLNFCHGLLKEAHGRIMSTDLADLILDEIENS